jgi:hypothetical protein
MSRTYRYRHLPRHHSWGGATNYIDSFALTHKREQDEKIWHYLAHEVNDYPCTKPPQGRPAYRYSHSNCIPGYAPYRAGWRPIQDAFDAIRASILYGVGGWHPYARRAHHNGVKKGYRVAANRAMRRRTREMNHEILTKGFDVDNTGDNDMVQGWTDYKRSYPKYDEYFNRRDLD